MPSASFSEIERKARLDGKAMKLYWWPKIATPAGWVSLPAESYDMSANVFVPKGTTFAKADAVLYARAFTQSDKARPVTLKEFIASDLERCRKQYPDAELTELPSIQSARGQAFKVYQWRYAKGTFEWASYGAEGEFTTLFVISSHSRRGLERYLPMYKNLLKNYR